MIDVPQQHPGSFEFNFERSELLGCLLVFALVHDRGNSFDDDFESRAHVLGISNGRQRTNGIFHTLKFRFSS
jgi:hypothetical protein